MFVNKVPRETSDQVTASGSSSEQGAERPYCAVCPPLFYPIFSSFTVTAIL